MNKEALENRVALVTGGSRGIGKSIALKLASCGAHVIVNYNLRKDAAENTVNEIVTSGGKAISLQADVSDEKSVKNLFAQIKAQAGDVDIVVNNAAISLIKNLLDITLQDFEQLLRVNLSSAFLVTQEAIPGMINKKYGRIINISSVAAQLGGVIGPHYAASKAGMLGLTHSYATLLAPYGITSNAVAPALIETDMIKNNPKVTPVLIPLKRFGLPEEVADAVLLLATNGYISGQTINVNGGWYMS